MPNQAIGFGSLLAGGVLIAAAITGKSLTAVMTGQHGGPSPLGGGSTPAPSSTGGGVGTTVPGDVKVAGGANRPGVGIQQEVLDFVGNVAGIFGKTLTIGTGTAHDRLTVDGNVSDHWDGHGVDIPAAGDELIRLGQDALTAAGMSEKEARTKTGGLFNLHYGGKRIQIIFNTQQGGDHTNHLHIGVR